MIILKVRIKNLVFYCYSSPFSIPFHLFIDYQLISLLKQVNFLIYCLFRQHSFILWPALTRSISSVWFRSFTAAIFTSISSLLATSSSLLTPYGLPSLIGLGCSAFSGTWGSTLLLFLVASLNIYPLCFCLRWWRSFQISCLTLRLILERDVGLIKIKNINLK